MVFVLSIDEHSCRVYTLSTGFPEKNLLKVSGFPDNLQTFPSLSVYWSATKTVHHRFDDPAKCLKRDASRLLKTTSNKSVDFERTLYSFVELGTNRGGNCMFSRNFHPVAMFSYIKTLFAAALEAYRGFSGKFRQ